MKITTLALAAALAVPAAAYAQNGWSTYHSPGSSWTNLQGTGANNGWSGQSYHQDDSSWTNTDLRGPNGETQHCSTFQSSGSSWANTTCY